jgi:hypothetical protein
MHAMAQPLALMRVHLYLARESETAGPLPAWFDDAEAAMERLCTVFQITQQLLQLQCGSAHPVSTSWSAILDTLPGDAEVAFAGTGLTFDQRFDPPAEEAHRPALPQVKSDGKFTRLALLSMLQVLRELARPQSAVHCSIAGDPGWVELKLTVEEPLDAPMLDQLTELNRLRLAVARAASASQGALFGIDAEQYALFVRFALTGEAA